MVYLPLRVISYYLFTAGELRWCNTSSLVISGETIRAWHGGTFKLSRTAELVKNMERLAIRRTDYEEDINMGDKERQSSRPKYGTRRRKTRLVLVACVYLSLIAVVFVVRGVSDYHKNSLLDAPSHRLAKRAVENGEPRSLGECK